LKEFISQVEAQITNSIEKYNETKQSIVESGYTLEKHKDFDDYTCSVKETFESTFPNYHRKSALITLHAFLEVELNRLCDWFKLRKELKLNVRDIKANGDIERATQVPN